MSNKTNITSTTFSTASFVANHAAHCSQAYAKICHGRILQQVIQKGLPFKISAFNELFTILQNKTTFEMVQVLLLHDGISIQKGRSCYKIVATENHEAMFGGDITAIALSDERVRKMNRALTEEAIGIIEINTLLHRALKLYKNRFFDLIENKSVDKAVNKYCIANNCPIKTKLFKSKKVKQLYPHN